MLGVNCDMKILSHVDNIGRNASDLISAAFNPIAMLAVGSQQLMTYYPINIEKTSIDRGFEDLGALVATDSEVRYNRIKNMISVGFTDMILDDSFLDDLGSNVEHTGSFHLYVDTIRPQAGDLFTLNIIDRPFIFVIKSSKSNVAFNEPMYEVNYEIKYTTQDKLDQLESQVIEEMVMTVHRFGDSESFVIEEAKFFSKKEIVDDSLLLIEMYRTLFFDETYSSFKYGKDDYHYIDWILHSFLYNHRLVVMDEIQVHGNSVYKQNNSLIYIEKPIVDRYEYDRSFYGRYMSNKLDEEVYLYPNTLGIPSQTENTFGDANRIVDRYSKTAANADEAENYFDQTFVDNIVGNILYADTEENYTIKNLIIKHYNGTTISDNDFDTLVIKDERSMDNFYLLPLIIYIYRKRLMS